MPVEAHACGRPVIAYARGGVLDTVVPIGDESGRKATGIYFDEPSPQSLAEAVKRFERIEQRFDPEAVRKHALQFSRERCKAELTEYLLTTENTR